MYKDANVFTLLWLVFCSVLFIRDWGNYNQIWFREWNIELVVYGLIVDFVWQVVQWIKRPRKIDDPLHPRVPYKRPPTTV